VVAVTEEEIVQSRDQLAHRGLYVEETSAAAVAGIAGLRDMLRMHSDDPIVVLLTGHGLKTSSG